MTDVRASGFASKRQLQEYLDDLSQEGEALPRREDEEVRSKRAAQMELAWLEREVLALRQSISAANGRSPDAASAKGQSHIMMRRLVGALAGIAVTVLLRKAGVGSRPRG